MNLRLSALVVASVCAFACSSSNSTPPSGGAAFQFQGADPAKAGMLGGCNDAQSFLIALKGDDGNNKLIVDGADDARVSCKIDDSHFDVTVSNKTASLSMQGSYASFKSGDATAYITFGANVSYTNVKGVPCTVTFTPDPATGNVVGDHGNIFAHFSCPALKAKTSDNACGIDVSGTANAYFQFSNCSGF